MSAPALPLSSALSGLSAALDLTEGHPRGHAGRTAIIAMAIARGLALDAVAASDVFYAALLKDAGSSANAGHLFLLCGASDERLAKRAAWLRDHRRLSSKVRYGLDWIEPGGSPLRRAGRAVRIAARGRRAWRELASIRSAHGAAAVRAMGFGDGVADTVAAVNEHWDGGGLPSRVRRDRIPLPSRIVGLAQVAELFRSLAGPARAMEIVHERSGRWFDPDLVACFDEVATSELWGSLIEDDPARAIAAVEPRDALVEATEARLDQVAAAFAAIVDAKSAFTAGHSERVAAIAAAVAERLGLPEPARSRLRHAALLHDLGKLSVPNAILDKAGPLVPEEWQTVHQHAYFTQKILQRVPPFADLADDAANHHERLDGRGYFRGLRGDALTPAARVIAVADVAAALLSARPYRPAVPLDRVLATMSVEAGTTLCAEVVAAFRDAVEHDPLRLRTAV
jgi:HD-GYP domain-containing protein (c-di-GMP phosphodiesterase class II)